MRVCISSAHGKNVSGAVGILNEVEESRRIVPEVVKYLKQAGAEVIEFHENNARDKNSNVNAIVAFHNSQQRDLDVSVHLNSVDGGIREAGIGVEVLYLTGNTQTHKLASHVARAISNASGLILRRGDGTLVSNLGFMRLTNKPAILIEVCFVNSQTDAGLYRENFDSICRAIAKAITGQMIPAAKTQTAPGTACDAPASGKIIDEPDKPVPIMGISSIAAEVMAVFLLSRSPEPKINCTPHELAMLYIKEGMAEGIRGDIAFCQAIHETGWFRYGGDVKPEQNNFAGIGAIGAGAGGAVFDAPEIGVLAHIHHLKAYASNEPLVSENKSPRFHLVTRGIAPNWIDLAGRWAVPGFDSKRFNNIGDAYSRGETYGQQILKIYESLKHYASLAGYPAYTPASDTSKNAEHWAEGSFQYLNYMGVTIHERRFDDAPTRGEMFALLEQYDRNFIKASKK